MEIVVTQNVLQELFIRIITHVSLVLLVLGVMLTNVLRAKGVTVYILMESVIQTRMPLL